MHQNNLFFWVNCGNSSGAGTKTGSAFFKNISRTGFNKGEEETEKTDDETDSASLVGSDKQTK